jgi:hypothetical protein
MIFFVNKKRLFPSHAFPAKGLPPGPSSKPSFPSAVVVRHRICEISVFASDVTNRVTSRLPYGVQRSGHPAVSVACSEHPTVFCAPPSRACLPSGRWRLQSPELQGSIVGCFSSTPLCHIPRMDPKRFARAEPILEMPVDPVSLTSSFVSGAGPFARGSRFVVALFPPLFSPLTFSRTVHLSCAGVRLHIFFVFCSPTSTMYFHGVPPCRVFADVSLRPICRQIVCPCTL